MKNYLLSLILLFAGVQSHAQFLPPIIGDDGCYETEYNMTHCFNGTANEMGLFTYAAFNPNSRVIKYCGKLSAMSGEYLPNEDGFTFIIAIGDQKLFGFEQISGDIGNFHFGKGNPLRYRKLSERETRRHFGIMANDNKCNQDLTVETIRNSAN